MSKSYNDAALIGAGIDDSYTAAALRGLGMDDSYTSAALRGGSNDMDDSYTSAALRGGKKLSDSALWKLIMKRMKEHSSTPIQKKPLAGGKKLTDSTLGKLIMKRLKETLPPPAEKIPKGGFSLNTLADILNVMPPAIRTTREIVNWIKGKGVIKGAAKTKGGKKDKMKGGLSLGALAGVLGVIPATYRVGREIYKLVKGKGKIKGGRNVYMNAALRDKFIDWLENESGATGRSKSALYPYKLGASATKHYNARLKRIPKAVKDYLMAANETSKLDDIVEDRSQMRQKINSLQQLMGVNKHTIFPDEDESSTTTTKRKKRTKSSASELPDLNF